MFTFFRMTSLTTTKAQTATATLEKRFLRKLQQQRSKNVFFSSADERMEGKVSQKRKRKIQDQDGIPAVQSPIIDTGLTNAHPSAPQDNPVAMGSTIPPGQVGKLQQQQQKGKQGAGGHWF